MLASSLQSGTPCLGVNQLLTGPDCRNAPSLIKGLQTFCAFKGQVQTGEVSSDFKVLLDFSFIMLRQRHLENPKSPDSQLLIWKKKNCD